MSRPARVSRINAYREELIAEIGYLTIREVARALRKRKEHVVFLMESGHLPYQEDGKRRKIRVVDLENYLANTPRRRLPEPDVRMRHKHRRQTPMPALELPTDPDFAALFA